MALRKGPWIAKPSPDVAALIEEAQSTSFFLVHRKGPTCFVVAESEAAGAAKHHVRVGMTPTCTCRSKPGRAPASKPTHAEKSDAAATANPVEQPCLHMLFVLLRVLRLTSTDPLLWQLSLTDREVEQLLAGGRRGSRAAQPASSSKDKQGAVPEAGTIQQRPIDQEEPCPICYESLASCPPGWLVWCQRGCGHNVHGKCMRVWSAHQTGTLGVPLTCPMCRSPWGTFDWLPPPVPDRGAAAAARRHSQPAHPEVKCSGCSMDPLQGDRYRCMSCPSYNLCSTCYNNGLHLNHSFALSSSPAAEEQLASRQAWTQLCAGITTKAQDSPVQEQQHPQQQHCLRYNHKTEQQQKGRSAAQKGKPTDATHWGAASQASKRCNGTKGPGCCLLEVSGLHLGLQEGNGSSQQKQLKQTRAPAMGIKLNNSKNSIETCAQQLNNKHPQEQQRDQAARNSPRVAACAGNPTVSAMLHVGRGVASGGRHANTLAGKKKMRPVMHQPVTQQQQHQPPQVDLSVTGRLLVTLP